MSHFSYVFSRKGWSQKGHNVDLILQPSPLFHHLLTYLLKLLKSQHGQSITTSPPEGLHGQLVFRGRKIRTFKTSFKPSWIVFGIGRFYRHGCKSKQKINLFSAMIFGRVTQPFLAIPESSHLWQMYHNFWAKNKTLENIN